MRFPDMVLKDHPAHKPIDCGCVVLALAQHEADMAYEVECLTCDGTGEQPYGGYENNYKGCLACGGDGEKTSGENSANCVGKLGTGRVTLGDIVAADRTRKEAMR